MSIPYHRVDWDLVAEVRKLQGQVAEQGKEIRELHRLVSAQAPPVNPAAPYCQRCGSTHDVFTECKRPPKNLPAG